MTFDLSLRIDDGVHDLFEDKCTSYKLCRIYFYKAYTPVVHYFNPPIIYYDSTINVLFDPKATTGLI